MQDSPKFLFACSTTIMIACAAGLGVVLFQFTHVTQSSCQITNFSQSFSSCCKMGNCSCVDQQESTQCTDSHLNITLSNTRQCRKDYCCFRETCGSRCNGEPCNCECVKSGEVLCNQTCGLCASAKITYYEPTLQKEFDDVETCGLDDWNCSMQAQEDFAINKSLDCWFTTYQPPNTFMENLYGNPNVANLNVHHTIPSLHWKWALAFFLLGCMLFISTLCWWYRTEKKQRQVHSLV
jgi:hypothetical protein